MLEKVLIKMYVVLFVINPSLLGVFQEKIRWIWIACVNVFLLFVILIDERRIFKTAAEQGKRILFAPDVFVLISVGI
jgi:hypothetical protein